MSRYITALESAGPVAAWSFDVDQAAVDSGTIPSSVGTNDLTLLTFGDGGVVELIPSMIPGLERSARFNLSFGDGDSNGNYSVGESTGIAEVIWNSGKDFSIEFVFSPKSTFRKNSGYIGFGFIVSLGRNLVTLVEELDEGRELISYSYILRSRDKVTGTTITTTSFPDFRFYPEDVYHVVIQRTGTNVTLTVNGQVLESVNFQSMFEATNPGEVFEFNDASSLRVGGQNANEGADVAFGSVAVFDRILDPAEVTARYELISSFESPYQSIEALSPDVTISPEHSNLGNIAPDINRLGEHCDAEFIRDKGAGTGLRLQTPIAAAGVSYEKKEVYDLSSFTTRVRSHFVMATTTDANSSVVAEYSFDNLTWYTLTQGDDTISELDANDVGGAVN
jgi:hypothetical protein